MLHKHTMPLENKQNEDSFEWPNILVTEKLKLSMKFPSRLLKGLFKILKNYSLRVL